MKKTILLSLAIICCMTLVTYPSFTQQVGKVELVKAAAKGNYSGTFELTNGHLAIFYQSSDGIHAYEFANDSKFVKEHTGAGASELLQQLSDQSVEVNQLAMKEFTELEVLYAGSSWGALKLQQGTLSLNSDKNFIYGYDYKKSEDKKLKAEGTWRTALVGNRAIIPEDMKVIKFRGQNGKYMSFTFSPSGLTTMTPVNGFIQSAGVITEKVNIKDPSPYNANRLVVFTVGGNSLEETSEISIMPYAMQGLGSGISAKGNFIVMTMPLNAPSTVKEQKELVAPEEDRNNLYIYEINDKNQVVSQAVHKSELRTVNYQATSTDENTYIVGTGAEGKNWRMFYAGQTAMSGLSIAVLDKEGKLIGSHSYLENALADKFEMAGTGKGKLQKFTGGPNFYRAEKLDNGNTFLFGQSDGYHHGILLSPSHELIKYYVFPHADLTKHTVYTHQLEVKGNNLYLVQSDQPFALSNDVQKSSSSRSYTTGNLRMTSTSETTTQLFEIYHLSQLFKIDGTNGNCTQMWLNDIEKNFHTLGERPAYFAKDGIYFAGRPNANKGKEISMLKIDY